MSNHIRLASSCLAVAPCEGAGLLHEPVVLPKNSFHVGALERKRRHEDSSDVPPKPCRISSAKNGRQHSVNKHKKARTPRIYGQPLPATRLIEVLDHASLQALVQKMLQGHPQVEEMIHEAAPKPSLAGAIALTRHKLQLLIDHLPYKCDPASDYSYLRVKPFFNDFLQCLSDFILNFLPPVELEAETSLAFLDEATSLVFKIPNFTNTDFQYTRAAAFEQIVNTWLVVLAQISPNESESSTEPRWDLVKVLKDQGLEQKIKHYDTLSGGMFKQVGEYIQSELDLVEAFKSASSSAAPDTGLGLLSDFITLDYSGYSITAQLSQ